MSGSWKQKERLVGTWFGTMRNPLSGRNNRSDDGSLRLGDILFKEAVVEVKRRATFSFQHADETQKLAKEYKKPWICLEFKTGKADMVRMSMDYKTAEVVCAALARYWKTYETTGRHADEERGG